jgi:hypothetical protein
MGIISKMRKQNAIYWPPAGVDDFGRESHGTPIELTLADGVNSRVRWEDKIEEFVDAEGTTQQSNAVVYVPALPGGGEVRTGGHLWLGDRADLTDEANPENNEGAYPVRRMDKLPNLKATEYLRTVYL